MYLPYNLPARDSYTHASCICGNKLILFGGFDEKYEMNLNDLRSLDLSHLRQNYVKWEQIRPAPGSRSPPGRTAHTMVAYENKLYMFGGHAMKGCRNDTWCFDMDTRFWTNLRCIGDIPRRRAHGSALLGDMMYIFGGRDNDNQVEGDLWEFRINEHRWHKFPDMPFRPSARSGHIMATHEGRILVFGGETNDASRLGGSTVHILDTSSIIYAEKRKIDASSIRHANCSYFTTPEGVLPRKGIGGNYSTRLSKSVEQIDSGSGTTFEVAYGRRIVLDGNETGIRELVEPVDAPEFSTLEVDSREIDDRFDQDITTPSTRDTITGAMSTTEILEYLVAHGCRKISEDFDISHVSKYPVSSGGFGDVYCATLRNGNRVGLKCMRVLVGSANEGRKFLKCVQIADGVKYLHEQSIVHGDLKLENILIAKDYAPKLTDFGNAMLTEYISLQFTATTTWQSISLRWTAPEIIKGETKSTREGDIYALGMTVPYSEAKDSTIMFRTLSGKTPSRPEPHIPTGIEQADHLWSIITGCWASDPTERPSAEEVRNMMARITPGGLLADIDQANQ
ncbi:unnamed protein product [Rhizoctonia solani]|uniref:Protein kinase domain-containing protein n=1 Tax=Rhizoctonia solani TaxID=456999 RepID=A0A8H3H5S9_9AGAM|nr:unnamed protein product [Rhizoctonia solani]